MDHLSSSPKGLVKPARENWSAIKNSNYFQNFSDFFSIYANVILAYMQNVVCDAQ